MSRPTAGTGAVHYPESDGQPMAETGSHVLAIVTLLGTLRLWLRARPDAYVISNIFWYWQEGDSKARKAPDVMVVFGVGPRPHERGSFRSWEEGGAVPAVVFEVTSEETRGEDQDEKRALYERLGVREYFLFDPLHDYLPEQLIGYRLTAQATAEDVERALEGLNGSARRYDRLVPGADGGLESAELGLRMAPEGELLALFSVRTGEKVPAPQELGDLLLEAQARLAAVNRELVAERRELARLRRRSEQAERESAEQRQRAEAAEREREQERQRAEAAEREREQERQRAEAAEREREQERRRADKAAEEATADRQRVAELMAELERLRRQTAPAGDA